MLEWKYLACSQTHEGDSFENVKLASSNPAQTTQWLVLLWMIKSKPPALGSPLWSPCLLRHPPKHIFGSTTQAHAFHALCFCSVVCVIFIFQSPSQMSPLLRDLFCFYSPSNSWTFPTLPSVQTSVKIFPSTLWGQASSHSSSLWHSQLMAYNYL